MFSNTGSNIYTLSVPGDLKLTVLKWSRTLVKSTKDKVTVSFQVCKIKSQTKKSPKLQVKLKGLNNRCGQRLMGGSLVSGPNDSGIGVTTHCSHQGTFSTTGQTCFENIVLDKNGKWC